MLTGLRFDMSRLLALCALVLAVGCSNQASVDTAQVAKLVGYPFSEPLVVTKVESTPAGLFGADTSTMANFQLGPNDLKALLDSCERWGFKRVKQLPLPEDIRKRVPKEQLTSVCVKEVKNEGLHTLYLHPAGLQYVWTNF